MILSILQHTPIWLFALFGLLVALGLRQTAPSRIHVARLVALPVAMSFLSLYGLLQSFAFQWLPIAAWAVVFASVIAIARSRGPRTDVQYSIESRSFSVPGSWLPLTLMMTIFLINYATSVLLAIDPSVAQSIALVASIGAVCGLSSGSFAARALRIWRTRVTAPSIATACSPASA
jgi:hypothetical protein